MPEKKSYALTNTIEVLDYYGADEDVAVFRLEERPMVPPPSIWSVDQHQVYRFGFP